ncbi:MAG: hypothetical protein ACFFC7_32820, partial [Candidatus Hermodarchaeota archaeon]
HLAHLLGQEEDLICLRVVKNYFASLPKFANQTRREQVQRWFQQPNVKATFLAELTPELFWRVLYDVPRVHLLEKIICGLYQKNNEARRTSTHLLISYILGISEAFDCELIAMEDLKSLHPTKDAKTTQLTPFQQAIQHLVDAKTLQAKALKDPTKTLQNRLKRFEKQTRPPKEGLERKSYKYQKRKERVYFDHLLDFLRMRAKIDPRAKARHKVSTWPRGLLTTMLQRKLTGQKDLSLVVVRAAGTSSRCCECHQEGRRNRQADTFKCKDKDCRYNKEVIHSETAASINIGLLGIWNDLSKSRKKKPKRKGLSALPLG